MEKTLGAYFQLTSLINLSCTTWRLQGAPTSDRLDICHMHLRYIPPLLLPRARCIQHEQIRHLVLQLYVARSRWSSAYGAANCRFNEHKLDGELYKQDSEIVRRGVYNRPAG